MDPAPTDGSQPGPFPLRSLTISDHQNNPVHIVWCAISEQAIEKPPTFPFQIYFTRSTGCTTRSSHLDDECRIERAMDLGRHLARVIKWAQRDRTREVTDFPVIQRMSCRFEVYSQPLPNILACVEHQREEICYRNRRNQTEQPRLLQNWAMASESGPSGRILVIDSLDWKTTGIVAVTFDPQEYSWEYRPWYSRERRTDEEDSDSEEFSQDDISEVATGEGYWDRVGGFNSYRLPSNLGGVAPENDLVSAVRCADSQPVSLLAKWWKDAGGSPPRYNLGWRPDEPDPTREDDDLETSSITYDEAERAPWLPTEDTPWDPIEKVFHVRELFQCAHSLEHVKWDTYSECRSGEVISLWDSRLSATRPFFSITLYVASDTPPLGSKELFNAMNQGLIANEAWTLDVVRNVSSLDAAFEHHTNSSARRTRSATSRARSCIRTVLAKLDVHFPEEVRILIEDCYVPPELPDYSSSRRRSRNAFLYLDDECISTGPLWVYSRPAAAQLNAETLSAVRREKEERGKLLNVVFLRYWHRVSDELHILWSVSSPRSPLPSGKTLPELRPLLTLRDSIVERARDGRLFLSFEARVYCTLLHTQEPITIFEDPALEADLWQNAFDLIDRRSGWNFSKELDQLPRPPGPGFYDSWHRTPALGFPKEKIQGQLRTIRPQSSFGDDEDDYPMIFQVDLHYNDEGAPPGSKFPDREGWLSMNGRYALRLKEGFTIPRWTYGTKEDLQGPFNLPPLPVIFDELWDFPESAEEFEQYAEQMWEQMIDYWASERQQGGTGA